MAFKFFNIIEFEIVFFHVEVFVFLLVDNKISHFIVVKAFYF